MKIKSIKKLAQVYKDGTFLNYDIGNCKGNKSQLILNYCNEKYGENAMGKFTNAYISFNYELKKLNYIAE